MEKRINNNANLYPIFDEILTGLYNKNKNTIQTAVNKLCDFDKDYDFQFCMIDYFKSHKFAHTMMRLDFLAWIGTRYDWDNLPNGHIYYIPNYKYDGTEYALVMIDNWSELHTIGVCDKYIFRKKYGHK